MKFAPVLLCCLALCSPSLAEQNSISYDFVNKGMKIMKTEDVGGIACVPFYLKTTEEGKVIDPKSADFHLKAADGKVVPLKIEEFHPSKEFLETDKGKDVAKENYTHLLWIPKDSKEFAGGEIVHSLPKGTVSMAYFAYYSKTFNLGKPADPAN